jgi:hypothetical protein
MEDVRRLLVGEVDEGRVTLDELAREGARRMIATALEAEVAATSSGSLRTATRTASGWWFRNGRARERKADGRVGHRADPGAAGQRQARG